MSAATSTAACAGTVHSVTSPRPGPIRIGNAERQSAVEALGEHFAQGRIDVDEFEERVTAAWAARTSADVEALFADLPRPPATPPAPHPMYPPAVRHAHAPHAPYGWDPVSGRPFSDRSKVIAGVLQILLPFGIGRFYSGHTGIGVAQLLLSFVGIGVVWAFLDGILMLLGRPTDPYGRPLRS